MSEAMIAAQIAGLVYCLAYFAMLIKSVQPGSMRIYAPAKKR